jgi:hypothetical protein
MWSSISYFLMRPVVIVLLDQAPDRLLGFLHTFAFRRPDFFFL